MREIRANNKFVVFTNSYLASSDMEVLKLLYLPILGRDSLNIYAAIRSELSLDKLLSKPKNHSHLIDIVSDKIEVFIKERQKLEAIGLLRTYEDFRNNVLTVLYEVNPPLAPDKFFMQPSTNKLLHKTIGHEKYKQLKSKFVVDKIDVTKLEQVTMKFDQIFKCNVNEKHHQYLTRNDRFADKTKIDIKHDNSDFDIEKFIQKAKRAEIPAQALTKVFLNFVVDTANTYAISESNMARYIKMSINNGKVNKEFIIQSCEVWANDKQVVQSSEFNIQELDDKELISIAKELDPISFLKYLYNGLKPSSRDKRLINEASRDYRLSDEVINILTYVSLIENDHRLSKEYYFFVATQWSRKGFKTASEALAQYKVTSKRKKRSYGNKSYKSNKKSNIDVPEWYNKDVEKKVPEKSEEERIKNMLNKW